MARRRTPSPTAMLALAAALLGTVSLGACGGGAGVAADDDPERDGPAAARAGTPDAPLADPADPADLAGETPSAPAAPTLTIVATPGALHLAWRGTPPDAERVRILAHDAASGEEHALALDLAPDADSVRLDAPAHRVRWGTLSYRVETCTAEDCLSSPRVPIEALAADAVDVIAPPVALAGERFGEGVAFAADGALLGIAAPVAGEVRLHFPQPGGGSVEAARLRVHDTPSASRTLRVAMSANGDTIAVLSVDRGTDPGTGAAIGIPLVAVFERLGEGWFESARFAAFAAPAPSEPSRASVRLSADGTRLLVACSDGAGAPVSAPADGPFEPCRLAVHDLLDAGWAPRDGPRTEDAAERLLGVAADADLERVFVAVARAGLAPALRRHERAVRWTATGTHSLDAFDGDGPLALAVAADGSRLAIGAPEASDAAHPAALLWRYAVGGTPDAPTLDALDAVRLAMGGTPPTALTLAADATLDTLAFGWRGTDDAALLVRVADADGSSTSLSLPDDLPDLAKRGFGTAVALDASGAALAIALPPGGAEDATGDVGRVLLLR